MKQTENIFFSASDIASHKIFPVSPQNMVFASGARQKNNPLLLYVPSQRQVPAEAKETPPPPPPRFSLWARRGKGAIPSPFALLRYGTELPDWREFCQKQEKKKVFLGFLAKFCFCRSGNPVAQLRLPSPRKVLFSPKPTGGKNQSQVDLEVRQTSARNTAHPPPHFHLSTFKVTN